VIKMVRITEQSAYSQLYDGIIDAFKIAVAELASGEDKVVEDIVEGEEDLGERNSVLMIVGGPDYITHSGMRNLLHIVEVYACYLSREITSVDILKKLRNISGHGYDLVMKDITLGNTVEACIPISVNPGFIKYGETIYVGVLQTWHIKKREGFVVPGS